MSRKKKPGSYKGQYTAMLRSTMETPAWRALSPVAQALFPWLRLEWRPGTNNNGKLSLAYRAAAKAMGVSKAETIGNAFRELQAKGFVVVHQVAALGVEGQGKSFEFEITDIEMPGTRKATRLFEQWSEGHDFEVKQARVGNPNGQGGKTKPHPAKRDSPIPRNGTVLPTPSRETVHPIPRNGTV